MKNLFILFFLAIVSLSANAQVQVYVKAGSLKVVKAGDETRGFPNYSSSSKEFNQTHTITSNGQSFTISTALVSSFFVNGVSYPVTYTAMRDSILAYSYNVVNFVSGTISSGGGGGSGDASAANQSVLIAVANQANEKLDTSNAVTKRDEVRQDTLLKRILRLEGKTFVSSDSSYTKQITAQLKAQRTADSTDFKRQLDSTVNANNDRRLLGKEATQLASKDTLVVLTGLIRLTSTLQKQQQTLDSIAANNAQLRRSIDSIASGNKVSRDSLGKLIAKQNDLITLQNVFNNLLLINKDTTKALLLSYRDSVAITNARLQLQVNLLTRSLDSLGALNLNKSTSILQVRTTDSLGILSSKLQIEINETIKIRDSLFEIHNTLKKSQYDVAGNLKVSSGTSSTPNAISNGSFTSSGTIAAGKKSIMVANIDSTAGVFNGATIPAGLTINFPEINNTIYGAITFNATGTTLYIATIE